MTVKELMEMLAHEDPNAEVMTEYHLHDYIRTVQAIPVDHVSREDVYVDSCPDAKPRNLISGDEELTERYLKYGYTPREVVIIK